MGGEISSWRKYLLSSHFQLKENQQSAGLVMNSIVSLHNSAAMKNIGNSLLRMCEVRMRRNIFRCQEKYWRPSWKILSGMMSHTAALWHHLTPTMYFLSSSTRVVTVLINQCKKIVFEISWIYWKSCNKFCPHKHIKTLDICLFLAFYMELS